MKVFIDTNVLISAVLFPNGTAAAAYCKAVTYPCCGMISEYNIEELYEVFQRKFPDKISALDTFLNTALTSLSLIHMPDTDADLPNLRDRKDIPILKAAVSSNADILLTGDKDFTEAGIDHPVILTPADFLLL